MVLYNNGVQNQRNILPCDIMYSRRYLYRCIYNIDSIVRRTSPRRRNQNRKEVRHKTRMGQRRTGSVSAQYMGRDAFLADAVDFRTGGNIRFAGDHFHFADHYSDHHVFVVGHQHEWKSKRRWGYKLSKIIRL